MRIEVDFKIVRLAVLRDIKVCQNQKQDWKENHFWVQLENLITHFLIKVEEVQDQEKTIIRDLIQEY